MESLLEVHPGHLYLLLAPRPFGRNAMNTLAAHLAVSGPLRVLDAGNWFDAYAIARLVRRQTAQLDQVLQNIRVARAFTCYQVLTLLEQYPGGEGGQTLPIQQQPPEHRLDQETVAQPWVAGDHDNCQPTLVFNLLSTFADESVALIERERLLDKCLKLLQQLSAHAPVAISATPVATEVFGRPFTPAPVSPTMLSRLQEVADQVVHFIYPENPVQGKLW
jgi:hypothetical protein